MPAYESYGRSGKAQQFGFFLIFLAGFAVSGAAFLRLSKNAAAGVTVAAILLVFVTLVLLSRTSDRRRLNKIRSMLESRGFDLKTDALTPERRRWAVERFGRYSQLRNDPNDVRWIASKPMPPGELVALRTTYLEGMGTTRSLYEMTTIVVAASIADNGPAVWVHRKTLGLRPEPGQEVKVGDERFEKRYRILSTDPAAPRRMLTPTVRELIASGPKLEWWSLGAGLVVCNFTADVDATGLATMLQRTETMTNLLAAIR